MVNQVRMVKLDRLVSVVLTVCQAPQVHKVHPVLQVVLDSQVSQVPRATEVKPVPKVQWDYKDPEEKMATPEFPVKPDRLANQVLTVAPVRREVKVRLDVQDYLVSQVPEVPPATQVHWDHRE